MLEPDSHGAFCRALTLRLFRRQVYDEINDRFVDDADLPVGRKQLLECEPLRSVVHFDFSTN